MPIPHNVIQLTGRVSAPSELYFLTDGTPSIRFWLYQDEIVGAGRYVSHAYRLTAWGGLAEALQAKVQRGDYLFVQGKLRFYSKGGQKEGDSRPEVQLTSFYLLEGRPKPNKDVSIKEQRNRL